MRLGPLGKDLGRPRLKVFHVNALGHVCLTFGNQVVLDVQGKECDPFVSKIAPDLQRCVPSVIEFGGVAA